MKQEVSKSKKLASSSTQQQKQDVLRQLLLQPVSPTSECQQTSHTKLLKVIKLEAE